jgi:hypothetical protein
VIRLISLVSLVALTSCAADMSGGKAGFEPIAALPSNDEVVSYVQTHWDLYSYRTARFQGRRGQAPSLIDVKDVSCQFDFGVPSCSFIATVSFEDGSTVDQRLFSQFDRYADGRLHEVVVMIHDRAQ